MRDWLMNNCVNTVYTIALVTGGGGDYVVW